MGQDASARWFYSVLLKSNEKFISLCATAEVHYITNLIYVRRGLILTEEMIQFDIRATIVIGSSAINWLKHYKVKFSLSLQTETVLLDSTVQHFLVIMYTALRKLQFFFCASGFWLLSGGKNKQKHKLSRNLGQEWHVWLFCWLVVIDWISADSWRRFEELRVGDQTVPTGPLIDGLIASSWPLLLRPQMEN